MRKVLLALAVLISMLLCAEVVMRVMGLKPHESGANGYRSIPVNSLIPDTLLASRLGEGDFTAIVKEKLFYHASHVRTGYDITRRIYDSLPAGLPRVDFHGCSFTYGMGVSDTQTYSYLYARDHKNWLVRNYGCPGYSTLEALIILQRQKKQKDLPRAVVINYLDFHDQRNLGTAEWREGMKQGFTTGAQALSADETNKRQTNRFPFAKPSGDHVEITWYTLGSLYHDLWLRDYSALVYASEHGLNHQLYDGDPVPVTRAIFHEIKTICDENKIDMIVTVMSQGRAADDMKKFLAENKIRMSDISIDFSKEIYTNHPYDGHPSPLAHRIFAEKLKDVEPVVISPE